MKILGLQITNNNYKPMKSEGISRNARLLTSSAGCDTVSFGNNNHQPKVSGVGLPAVQLHNDLRELKNIRNLPCVYCGQIMLPIADRNKIAAEIASSKGEDLIANLKKNMKYLRGVKQNIAHSVIWAAKKNPDDNIAELLKKLAPRYKAELEAEQLAILRKIERVIDKYPLSPEEKTAYQYILYDTNQWINNENDAEPFKRKEFLYQLQKVLDLPLFKNRQVVKKVLKKADKMPQSFESENAFIVKYHRRSPREISEQLFYDALSTIEHIKTRETGGKTESKNLAIACARCNNYVRNNTPMPKFIKDHPEVPDNIRKNLDAVWLIGQRVRTIRSSQVQNLNMQNQTNNPSYQRYLSALGASHKAYENYVRAVAQTFVNESGGALDLSEYIKK